MALPAVRGDVLGDTILLIWFDWMADCMAFWGGAFSLCEANVVFRF